MSNNRVHTYAVKLCSIFFVYIFHSISSNLQFCLPLLPFPTLFLLLVSYLTTLLAPDHGREKHFYLYLLSLFTILYLLSFIVELCQNKNPLDKPKIKYTKAELLNLRAKAYIARMDTDTCKYIKNLKIKQNFRRKTGGKYMPKNMGQ